MSTLPISLTHLTEQGAVVDAMYRVLIGIDAHNVDMFDSGLMKEGTLSMSGHAIEGRDQVKVALLYTVGPMDTVHTTTNIRVGVG
jgi:hypothetical protein